AASSTGGEVPVVLFVAEVRVADDTVLDPRRQVAEDRDTAAIWGGVATDGRLLDRQRLRFEGGGRTVRWPGSRTWIAGRYGHHRRGPQRDRPSDPVLDAVAHEDAPGDAKRALDQVDTSAEAGTCSVLEHLAVVYRGHGRGTYLRYRPSIARGSAVGDAAPVAKGHSTAGVEDRAALRCVVLACGMRERSFDDRVVQNNLAAGVVDESAQAREAVLQQATDQR